MVEKNVAQNRQEQMLIKKAREEIEKRTGKTPEELFAEREKRITDTVQLKVPDRVPVCLNAGYFPFKYTGLPPSATFYNPTACLEAIIKTLLDFDADVCITPMKRGFGIVLEKLGSNQMVWPGGPVPYDHYLPQFLEMEMMKENEYDLFITDPGDFIMRYYLPRSYKSLAPLSKLPPIKSLMGGSVLWAGRFADPEIIQAFKTIFEAGQEQVKFGEWHQGSSNEEVCRQIGIPPLYYGGVANQPPFDVFVSYLRGMRGTMIDMFKCPEKLRTAMERVLEWEMARVFPVEPEGKRVSAGGNHFQSEEFLSKKQFETFVWPTWKKSLLSVIDFGYVPRPYMEGKNDDRIELFLELPKGKAFIGFEKIDIVRAKAILGGHLCIDGNVPGALLWGGSPQDVEEYCKNLIKDCGKGGGFILNSSCTLDDAKPANVKAMIDSVKKYGRYY